MSFATRELRSGLVVAEESADEAGLSRALKRIDDRLVLQKHQAEVEGGWVYKVLRIVSDHAPAEHVATWADEYGRPLPLSSGLLDLVNSLRRDAPHKGPSADERNEQHVARLTEEARARDDTIIGEHRPRLERGRVTVAVGSKSAVPYWRKNRRGPSSSGGAR